MNWSVSFKRKKELEWRNSSNFLIFFKISFFHRRSDSNCRRSAEQLPFSISFNPLPLHRCDYIWIPGFHFQVHSSMEILSFLHRTFKKITQIFVDTRQLFVTGIRIKLSPWLIIIELIGSNPLSPAATSFPLCQVNVKNALFTNSLLKRFYFPL